MIKSLDNLDHILKQGDTIFYHFYWSCWTVPFSVWVTSHRCEWARAVLTDPPEGRRQQTSRLRRPPAHKGDAWTETHRPCKESMTYWINLSQVYFILQRDNMLIKLNVTILLVFSTKRLHVLMAQLPVLTIITLDSWPIYKTVINGTA